MSGIVKIQPQPCSILGFAHIVMILTVVLAITVPVRAEISREVIVKPWRDDTLLCKEAMAEIVRQANLRQKQIEELKAWHTRCHQAIAEAEERLKEENDRKAAVADRVVNGAQSLVLNSNGDFHVPGFGWGLIGKIAQHTVDTNTIIAESMKPVSDGTAQFHVPGLGWVTRQGLAKIIVDDDKAIADLRASVDAGTFQIYYPALNWVSRTVLEGRITANDKSIADTFASIEAGTYQVYIPQLAWINRNGLLKLIEEAEAEYKTIEDGFGAGDTRIHRPLLAWFSFNQLQGSIEDIRKQIAAHQQSVTMNMFRDHVASYGWATGQELDSAIASVEQGIADVKAAVAAGNYGVPLATGGWANAIQIREASKQPNLKPEQRAALEMGMRHIATASEVDISIRELDLAKLKLYKAALAQQAMPLEDRLNLDLNQRADLQAEFDLEKLASKHRIDRRIAWLRQCLEAYIPR